MIGNLHLRTKLMLLIALVIMAVMLPLSLFTVRSAAQTKEVDRGRSFSAIARLIAQIEMSAVATGKRMAPQVFQKVFELYRESEPALAFVMVADAEGRLLLGRINERVVGFGRLRTEAEALAYLHGAKAQLPPDLRVVAVDLSDQSGETRRHRGQVKVGFSLRDLRQENREALANNLLITLLLIVLGMAISQWFSRIIAKPVERLVAGMERVRNGDFETQVAVNSRDEIGQLAGHFNAMTQGLKEREWIKSTFARYVSRQVADKILREKRGQSFEGELRKVTILFADIRGFMALAEQLKPREIVALLNEYFDAMIDVIFKYEGTLDKFVGDQIMAVFGAPLDQDGTELRAIRTALEMQAAVARINTSRTGRRLATIQVGIGINTGDVVAGNIGSEKRMEYTVIGYEVNLAQRIEAASARDQILISANTYAAVRELVDVTPLPEAQVKGKKEAVQLYAVLRLRA